MTPRHTWPKAKRVAQILQYVHDHTGNSHPPAMLHTNNMLDRLKAGHSPASVATAELQRLVARAVPHLPPPLP